MRFRWLLFGVAILCAATAARADVAPPVGYKQETLPLRIETTENLADYRFFLEFYGDLHEVELGAGETLVPPKGGGARYASGNLWAAPRESLEEFGPPLTPAMRDALAERLVKSRTIAGAEKLLTHRYRHEIPFYQSPAETVYVISRDGAKLAVRPKPYRTGFSGGFGIAAFVGLAAGGLLLAAAVAVGGWLLFRKARKKG